MNVVLKAMMSKAYNERNLHLLSTLFVCESEKTMGAGY